MYGNHSVISPPLIEQQQKDTIVRFIHPIRVIIGPPINPKHNIKTLLNPYIQVGHPDRDMLIVTELHCGVLHIGACILNGKEVQL